MIPIFQIYSVPLSGYHELLILDRAALCNYSQGQLIKILELLF
jgi:hypothetical protein